MVILKQSIGAQFDFLLHLKIQNCFLKYAQNQRAKTIFVFSTKTYLLKHGIFFNFLLKNRWEEGQKKFGKKKRNSCRTRKEGEISLGPLEMVKENYGPYELAPETRCGLELKILLKTPP